MRDTFREMAFNILRWRALIASVVLFAGAAPCADLFFVSDIGASGFSQHPSQSWVTIYRVVQNHLIESPLNAKPPAFLRFVIADQDLRMIFIGGDFGMPSEFQLMSMDEPGVVKQSEVNVTNRNIGDVYFATPPGGGPKLLLDLDNLEEVRRGQPLVVTPYVLDLSTGLWANGTLDIYRYLRMLGGTAGFVQDDESWTLQEFDSGQLMMLIAQRVLEFGPILPVDLRFPDKNSPRLYLSNPAFAAVAERTSGAKTIYRILDRARNQWIGLPVPGNASWNVRAFGSWMTGIVDESLWKKPFRLSPKRHKTGNDEIVAIDDWLRANYIYRTGTLFLYDVASRRYYQWDTGNGDCEVLLVQDGYVYYRVDTALYRAAIGAKELGKAELLVEDPAAFSIHWAFFGPSAAAHK